VSFAFTRQLKEESSSEPRHGSLERMAASFCNQVCLYSFPESGGFEDIHQQLCSSWQFVYVERNSNQSESRA
jgi:hypothetical protein